MRREVSEAAEGDEAAALAALTRGPSFAIQKVLEYLSRYGTR